MEHVNHSVLSGTSRGELDNLFRDLFISTADALPASSWIPRRCFLTNRWIWLEPVTKLERVWVTPIGSVKEVHWVGARALLTYLLTH
jgi:hypothetical protein